MLNISCINTNIPHRHAMPLLSLPTPHPPHITSPHITSFYIIPPHTTSQRTTSHHITLYRITSRNTTSPHLIPLHCTLVTNRIVPYITFHYPISHYFTLHHITLLYLTFTTLQWPTESDLRCWSYRRGIVEWSHQTTENSGNRWVSQGEGEGEGD